jgi:hypothetical protein
VEVRLQVRRARRDVRAVLVAGYLHVLDLDFLVALLVGVLDFELGDDRALHRYLAQFGDQDLAAQVALEFRNRQLLFGQHRGVGVLAGKLAVGKQVGNHLLDRSAHVVIADLEAQPGGLVSERPLTHHPVHHLRDVGGDQLGGKLPAAHGGLDQAHDIARCDFVPADRRHHRVRRGSARAVLGHQVGQHRQCHHHQQCAQQDAHRFFSAAKQIKHESENS